jgi:hypothetical protein
VRVLGKLFRRLFLTRRIALHDAGKLAFFGGIAHLIDRRALLRQLEPVRKKRWVVYAKPPFAGPEAVLAYLSGYTHRVAIGGTARHAFTMPLLRRKCARHRDVPPLGPASGAAARRCIDREERAGYLSGLKASTSGSSWCCARKAALTSETACA